MSIRNPLTLIISIRMRSTTPKALTTKRDKVNKQKKMMKTSLPTFLSFLTSFFVLQIDMIFPNPHASLLVRVSSNGIIFIHPFSELCCFLFTPSSWQSTKGSLMANPSYLRTHKDDGGVTPILRSPSILDATTEFGLHPNTTNQLLLYLI